jgi:hypothetical protein
MVAFSPVKSSSLSGTIFFFEQEEKNTPNAITNIACFIVYFLMELKYLITISDFKK